MTWEVVWSGKKQKLKNSILIAGLPGIGNVGKIAVDFLKQELKAKKIVEFWSGELPHTVFVNEKNLVELPSIQLWHVLTPKRDLLLLVGDAQPVTETACYGFCETFIGILQELGCSDVVTLGGIALRHVPKKPQVYCIGANRKTVAEFVKGTSLKTELFGVVGPIIGVTGVLAGLASRRGLNAVIVLAETFGHPMFLGIASAREILLALSQKLGMTLHLESLTKEMKHIDDEMRMYRKEMAGIQQGAISKLHGRMDKEQSYIG
ncbi:PAC2 family protein [Candidatus Woesearchaeota archaeon]|nr:PAC2 family protein [Candidatus Woesearchaeota archaeon]